MKRSLANEAETVPRGSVRHPVSSSNAWIQKGAFGNKENQRASELLLFPACFQDGSNLRPQPGAACVGVAPQEAGFEIFSPGSGLGQMVGTSGLAPVAVCVKGPCVKVLTVVRLNFKCVTTLVSVSTIRKHARAMV